MATTTQHINARNDPDLLDRFIASAEQADIDNASQWVQANMGKLVGVDVDGGQTVADVHAYAKETRDVYIDATPDRPGVDLVAVTDSHLTAAITAVRTI
ncbi:hypothetical protein [Microbacterium allomyrinae]|uniref:Uncharacterized protein n=1 Tax=Microbacterium allomyrinae TaxID=2830666 RepID=A0A9X1S4J1_9MICO|nr:hypothetical protein [Microbacterium allomyrinae]MCC2033060.1 hypothetical protein [Microbacterium allomyrinae]